LAFRVDITEAALADAENFVEYVSREKGDTAGAERWWNGLLDALFSLEQSPGRGSLVVEAALRTRGLRQIADLSWLAPGTAEARCPQMKSYAQQASLEAAMT
jgi:hypothetical protein